MWSPTESCPDDDYVLGFLVLRGTLCQRLRVGPRHTADLIGPGDLLLPRETGADQYATIAADTSWHVLEPTWLAVLDGTVGRHLARWPSIVGVLMARGSRSYRSLAVRLAIAQVPKLCDRLLLLFWHLADRWGHVGPDGVLVPLHLSHRTLAELAAAQRPSVSVALRELAQRALIIRLPGVGWRLHGNPPPELTTLLAPRLRSGQPSSGPATIEQGIGASDPVGFGKPAAMPVRQERR